MEIVVVVVVLVVRKGIQTRGYYKSVFIIKVTIIRFAMQMFLTCGYDMVQVPYNCYLHMYTTVYTFFMKSLHCFCRTEGTRLSA